MLLCRVRAINRMWSAHCATAYFILLFAILPNVVCGQNDFVERKYSLNGVVSENQIADILPDNNGYYWILTRNGKLIRWDGRHFELLNRNAKENGSRMLTDNNGGIYVFEVDKNSFEYIDSTSQPKLLKMDRGRIPGNPTYSFVAPSLTLGEIEKRNPVQLFNRFKHIFSDSIWKTWTKIYSIGPDEFYAVPLYATNNMWRQGTCIFYDHGKLSEIRLNEEWSKSTYLIGKFFLMINAGYYKLFSKDTLVKAGFSKTLKELTWGATREVATRSSDGYLFIANKTGVYRINWSNDQLLVDKYLDAAGIDNFEDYANTLYCDVKADKIIAAPVTGGFSVFEKRYFTIRELSSRSYENIVYSIASRGDQLVTNQNFQRKVKPGSDDYGFVSPVVLLPGGDIFYPGFPRALLTDRKFNIKKTWSLGYKQVKFAVRNKNFVYLDSHIPYKFDVASHKISEWDIEPALTSTEKIWCLASGPGNLIYAAIDSFLYSINVENNRREKLTSFSLGRVRSLFYDPGLNILFITLVDRPIYIFRLSDGHLFELPLMGFQQVLSCHFVLKDRVGDYWLPSNNGLFFMKAETLKSFLNGKSRYVFYFLLGAEYGLVNEEFNGGFSQGGVTINDSIFLSSMSGIVSFDPEILKRRLSVKGMGKILTNSIIIDDSLVDTHNTVVLPAGYKRCVFKFSFPYINLPTAQLEYQLKGLSDTTWNLLMQNGEILIRGLSAGKYELNIRVKDNREIQPVTIKIVAEEYWYKTAVAYICYAGLFMLLLFILVNWRIHIIRNKSLKEIDGSRRELLAIVSHDLRSPLRAYQGLADNISYLIKRKEYKRIDRIAAQIDSTSAKIDLLMNNLLKWDALQQQKLLISNESFSLNELVRELKSLYKDIASFTRVKVVFNSDQGIFIRTDKDLVALVVRNLLDNAVKNSPEETCIYINIVENHKTVMLSVINSISEDERERVSRAADLITEGENWEPGQQGMGFGLKMVKLALEKIEAKIMMEVRNDVVTTKILINNYP